MKQFNAKKVKEDLVQWIRDWFEINGKGCNAVVGISGGIDSSVVAALCVEALGKERVRGLLLPQGNQDDIAYAYYLCGQLGIHFDVINIEEPVKQIINNLRETLGIYGEISDQAIINLPPRIRMSILYAYSQSVNGRVMNTSNLSESWLGYDTRYGDSVGDSSPLFCFTKTEIKMIATELDLDECLIYKIPSDGLCGKTDEDRWGFSYEVLDKYIRIGICEDLEVKAKIDSMHEKNLFKLQPMPHFEYVAE